MIMGRPRLGWLVTVGWGGAWEGTVAVVVAILAVSMLVVTNIAVGGADDLSIQIIRIYARTTISSDKKSSVFQCGRSRGKFILSGTMSFVQIL